MPITLAAAAAACIDLIMTNSISFKKDEHVLQIKKELDAGHLRAEVHTACITIRHGISSCINMGIIHMYSETQYITYVCTHTCITRLYLKILYWCCHNNAKHMSCEQCRPLQLKDLHACGLLA